MMTRGHPGTALIERSPELALTVACCARAIGLERDIASFRGRVAGERLLAVARRHRVAGLVWSGLADSDGLTAEVRRGLQADARAIAEEGLRAAGQCRALAEALAGERIDFLFLKGLAVGKLAYGNALLKASWDIDLLVAEADVGRAGALLRDLGYVGPEVGQLQRWHRVHKETTWVPATGAPVELHSRLADSRRLIPGIGLASPRQEVEVVPGLALPTLAGDELLAYLAVHGASSAWFRLKWIADFAGLLKGRSAGGVERLAARMGELGAGRAGGQALLLANWLFGTPVPAWMGEDRATRRLTRIALAQLTAEREPTMRPLGTATIHLSQLLLLPGAGFAAGEAARQAQEVAERLLRR